MGRRLGQIGSNPKNEKKNKKAREYYAKHLNEMRAYYANRRKEKRLEMNAATKRYVIRNRDEVNTKQRLRHRANPELHRQAVKRYVERIKKIPEKRTVFYERIKRYAKANSEKKKSWKRVEYVRRKKYKSKTIPFDNQLWLDRVNASPMCSMCGRFVGCENMTQDHIVPLSKRGYHALPNLAPLCSTCNSLKHNQMPNYDVVKQIIKMVGASRVALRFCKK